MHQHLRARPRRVSFSGSQAYIELRAFILGGKCKKTRKFIRALCFSVLSYILERTPDSILERRIILWGVENYGNSFLMKSKEEICSKPVDVLFVYIFAFLCSVVISLIAQAPFILYVELRLRIVLMAIVFIASGFLSWRLMAYIVKGTEEHVRVVKKSIVLTSRGVETIINPRDLQTIRYENGKVRFAMKDSRTYQAGVSNIFPIFYVCAQEFGEVDVEPLQARIAFEIVVRMAQSEYVM